MHMNGVVPLPLLQEKVDQIVRLFANDTLSLPEPSAIITFIRDSPMTPVFTTLEARLVTVLRDFLMYPYPQLVSSALSLIFRLESIKSEVSGLLQELQLLQSPTRMEFYHQVPLGVAWGWVAVGSVVVWGH